NLTPPEPAFAEYLYFIRVRGTLTRGIFISAYTQCALSEAKAQALFQRFYQDSSFVHVSESPLHLKQVVNTNKGLLHVQKEGDKLLVTSIIDNLLKGASGQAVENMNLMYGFDQKTGLRLKSSAF